MITYMSYYPPTLRRLTPRIPTETLCAELTGDEERYGLIVDLSEDGLRIQRPLAGGRSGPIVQLEFELPGVDEIVWAKGEVCFDQLWRAQVSPTGTLRTTGYRLVAAAQKHLRLLRDYVHETYRAQATLIEPPWYSRFRMA
jgi:hypothetical protein